MSRLARSLLVLALLAGTASARSEKTLAYARDQAWPTAVRFLRVDEHLKITEKDADAGFVLFELHEEQKTFRGSLEVITIVKDGRSQVRFVIAIEDRPSYLEISMLERLERKLKVELGSPAPRPTPKPKPDPDDEPKKDEPKKDEPKKDPKPEPEPPDSNAPVISPTP
jgi:hypothetical protein